MSILTFLESWLKEKSIPVIYILSVLYLFLIDIIILLLLGYQPRDILFLVDIEKIVLFNTFIIIVFTLIYLMIKKHLIASATIAFLLTISYAMYYNEDSDKYLDITLYIFGFIVLLAFNIYKVVVEPWLDTLWKLSIANVFIGFLFTTMIIIFIDGNIFQWNSLIKNNTKIELDRTHNPFLVVKPKSFSPIYLQELNQDLKLFTNSTFVKKLSKQFYIQDNVNNQNFVLVPHNGRVINNKPITIYYYDVENIKNIFILNPTTCDKDGKCELQTLITKAVNKNDSSKGYQLISDYTNVVQIEG